MANLIDSLLQGYAMGGRRTSQDDGTSRLKTMESLRLANNQDERAQAQHEALMRQQEQIERETGMKQLREAIHTNSDLFYDENGTALSNDQWREKYTSDPVYRQRFNSWIQDERTKHLDPRLVSRVQGYTHKGLQFGPDGQSAYLVGQYDDTGEPGVLTENGTGRDSPAEEQQKDKVVNVLPDIYALLGSVRDMGHNNVEAAMLRNMQQEHNTRRLSDLNNYFDSTLNEYKTQLGGLSKRREELTKQVETLNQKSAQRDQQIAAVTEPVAQALEPQQEAPVVDTEQPSLVSRLVGKAADTVTGALPFVSQVPGLDTLAGVTASKAAEKAAGFYEKSGLGPAAQTVSALALREPSLLPSDSGEKAEPTPATTSPATQKESQKQEREAKRAVLKQPTPEKIDQYTQAKQELETVEQQIANAEKAIESLKAQKNQRIKMAGNRGQRVDHVSYLLMHGKINLQQAQDLVTTGTFGGTSATIEALKNQIKQQKTQFKEALKGVKDSQSGHKQSDIKSMYANDATRKEIVNEYFNRYGDEGQIMAREFNRQSNLVPGLDPSQMTPQQLTQILDIVAPQMVKIADEKEIDWTGFGRHLDAGEAAEDGAFDNIILKGIAQKTVPAQFFDRPKIQEEFSEILNTALHVAQQSGEDWREILQQIIENGVRQGEF